MQVRDDIFSRFLFGMFYYVGGFILIFGICAVVIGGCCWKACNNLHEAVQTSPTK